MTTCPAPLDAVTSRARALRAALEDELRHGAWHAHLQPPEAWCLDNQRVKGSIFGEIGSHLHEQAMALSSRPEPMRRLFGACVACALVETFDQRCVALTPTDDLNALYVREFGRMLDHAESRSPYWADLLHDGPRKDLALLAGRLVPVGAGVAAPHSGLARSTLWRGSWQQAIRFSRLLWGSGGATRWLEIHTHTDSLSEFSADGWMQTYLRLARLLRANPSIRGVFRASWFLDPDLQAISPNLGYLAALPRSGGAALFYVEHDPSGTCGALQRSERRRHAFESGQYVPAIYLMAWPRRNLLDWSDGIPDAHRPVLTPAAGPSRPR